MKLLLTSAGITNDSLKNALIKLVNNDLRIAYVPTASNIESGDKGWLVDDLVNLKEMGELDIVDISALPKEVWIKRIEWSNVLCVGGGDTKYLMDQINKSGFDKELSGFLKDKVYVGISAGSIILSRKLWASSEFLYEDEVGQSPDGLGFVDFNFRPHLNSKYFPLVRKDKIREVFESNPSEKIYAMDDNSGLLFVDGKIKVVSEGDWELFGEK